MEHLLQVRNLRTYFFGGGHFTRAVDDVSFNLRNQGRLGIVGQSGSGKTQTLLSIVGLVDGRPGIVGGEMIFAGEDLYEGLDEFVNIRETASGLEIDKDEKHWGRQLESNYAQIRGRRMGVIFQEPKSALVPYQTIERQMQEAAEAVDEESASFDRDRALSIFESMRFPDPDRILRSYPFETSGGESQRATIGIVLESDPDLILADEPTSSLDPESAGSVLELLDEIVSDGAKSLIFVTHDADLLRGMVDHVAVMYAGSMVEYGSTDSIIAMSDGAVHPYTERLVSAGFSTTGLLPFEGLEAESASVGCPYHPSCPLRPQLASEAQFRCEHERPEPVSISGEHWAACWGLDEVM